MNLVFLFFLSPIKFMKKGKKRDIRILKIEKFQL